MPTRDPAPVPGRGAAERSVGRRSVGNPFNLSLTNASTLTLNATGGITFNNVTINTSGSGGLNLVLNANIATAGNVYIADSTLQP